MFFIPDKYINIYILGRACSQKIPHIWGSLTLYSLKTPDFKEWFPSKNLLLTHVRNSLSDFLTWYMNKKLDMKLSTFKWYHISVHYMASFPKKKTFKNVGIKM